MDLGVLEETDKENDDADNSDMYRKRLDEGLQFQNSAEQANLIRIEMLLTRNSNFIKEPQLYSKDIEI